MQGNRRYGRYNYRNVYITVSKLYLVEHSRRDDKILKDQAKCRIIWRRVPKHIWDFCAVREAEIYSRTVVKDR